ncbi:hypothetical protein ACFL43_05100 [Thermodesulfobacteriota bacterium]
MGTRQFAKLAILIALVSIAGLPGAFAQQDMQPQLPPPRPSSICTDGQYLYLLAGKTIMKCDAATMELAASADLPEQERSEAAPADLENDITGERPSPFMQRSRTDGRHRRRGQLCTDGTSLFVAIGKAVLQYDTATLELVSTLEIPVSEPPEDAVTEE